MMYKNGCGVDQPNKVLDSSDCQRVVGESTGRTECTWFIIHNILISSRANQQSAGEDESKLMMIQTLAYEQNGARELFALDQTPITVATTHALSPTDPTKLSNEK